MDPIFVGQKWLVNWGEVIVKMVVTLIDARGDRVVLTELPWPGESGDEDPTRRVLSCSPAALRRTSAIDDR